MNDSSFTVRARWLLPIDRPPIENGMLTIVNGRIAEVASGKYQHVDFDLGDVVLLPGFVNAHTHLDLGGFRGMHTLLSPVRYFTEWLQRVVHYRRNSDSTERQEAIQNGIAASLRNGTTLVGDIAADGLSWDLLARSPLRAVVFYELIGLSRDRAKQSRKAAAQWLRDHPRSELTRPGLSPHAPYSVRQSLARGQLGSTSQP